MAEVDADCTTRAPGLGTQDPAGYCSHFMTPPAERLLAARGALASAAPRPWPGVLRRNNHKSPITRSCLTGTFQSPKSNHAATTRGLLPLGEVPRAPSQREAMGVLDNPSATVGARHRGCRSAVGVRASSPFSRARSPLTDGAWGLACNGQCGRIVTITTAPSSGHPRQTPGRGTGAARAPQTTRRAPRAASSRSAGRPAKMCGAISPQGAPAVETSAPRTVFAKVLRSSCPKRTFRGISSVAGGVARQALSSLAFIAEGCAGVVRRAPTFRLRRNNHKSPITHSCPTGTSQSPKSNHAATTRGLLPLGEVPRARSQREAMGVLDNPNVASITSCRPYVDIRAPIDCPYSLANAWLSL